MRDCAMPSGSAAANSSASSARAAPGPAGGRWGTRTRAAPCRPRRTARASRRPGRRTVRRPRRWPSCRAGMGPRDLVARFPAVRRLWRDTAVHDGLGVLGVVDLVEHVVGGRREMPQAHARRQQKDDGDEQRVAPAAALPGDVAEGCGERLREGLRVFTARACAIIVRRAVWSASRSGNGARPGARARGRERGAWPAPAARAWPRRPFVIQLRRFARRVRVRATSTHIPHVYREWRLR